MLFGLHRESSSGHAGQTRRWGDVLGAVPGEGARDAPSLFRARRNGHSDAYIHGLEIKIKQLIERITTGSPYVFQQGSASPHIARKSQAWCVRNLQMVWTQCFVPLISPDLNPMDCFVWSVVGSKANEHRVAGRDTPKHQITEVTDSIDKEGVARACACFRTRIKKVIDAKGDHI